MTPNRNNTEGQQGKYTAYGVGKFLEASRESEGAKRK